MDRGHGSGVEFSHVVAKQNVGWQGSSDCMKASRGFLAPTQIRADCPSVSVSQKSETVFIRQLPKGP